MTELGVDCVRGERCSSRRSASHSTETGVLQVDLTRASARQHHIKVVVNCVDRLITA